MNKFVSILLAVTLLVTMLSAFSLPASAEHRGVPKDQRVNVADPQNVGKWASFHYDYDYDYDDIKYRKYEYEYFYIIATEDIFYPVACYYKNGSFWEYEENVIDMGSFVGIFPDDSEIPGEVRDMANRDYPDISSSGSTLSEGNLAIITAVGGLAVGFVAAMIIFKKKKPAPAGVEKEEE